MDKNKLLARINASLAELLVRKEEIERELKEWGFLREQLESGAFDLK